MHAVHTSATPGGGAIRMGLGSHGAPLARPGLARCRRGCSSGAPDRFKSLQSKALILAVKGRCQREGSPDAATWPRMRSLRWQHRFTRHVT
jgi:hypothetical protein